MTEEFFDVVNDRNEVIGQLPRPEVHRLGLKHRAVHVLIFNSRDEVFLQRRSLTKDTFPGAWDSSASGHCAVGEDYDDCALREVQEELGITLPRIPERLFDLPAGAETGQEFVWVYQARFDGPLTLNPEEITEGGWFAREKVSRWMQERPRDFASALPLIWRRLHDGRQAS